ncbi:unnamed protein product [Blepharisma stoltei]|uniref:Uncharacterized protein n=1 Tax=Blepharisma stoltei TaxID=1481888 RepID=A0AAU9JYH3_9CILI|nr:unnamed protein product [Blepharisma stoltei]
MNPNQAKLIRDSKLKEFREFRQKTGNRRLNRPVNRSLPPQPISSQPHSQEVPIEPIKTQVIPENPEIIEEKAHIKQLSASPPATEIQQSEGSEFTFKSIDTSSIQSDSLQWEDLSSLTKQLTTKQKEAESAKVQCLTLEMELENEKNKGKLMEEELKELRGKLRKLDSEGQVRKDQQKIEKLNADIDNRNCEAENLQREIEIHTRECTKLRDHSIRVSEEYKRYKTQSHEATSRLEEDIKILTARLHQPKNSFLDSQISELQTDISSLRNELSALHQECDMLYLEIQDKDEEIQQLDLQLNQLKLENDNLYEPFNYEALSFPAEPPEPSYSPVVDIHPQSTDRLVSDVGSTGAWNSYQKSLEESKEAHYASPDPFENLFHQSTGETSHHYKEEPATPPLEYMESQEELREDKTPPASQRSFEIYQEVEESKETGTPKREDASSGRPSRNSTPPRISYERNMSPAPQVLNERVHNLTQLRHPLHYSIPAERQELEDDFFAEMQRNDEERRKRNSSARQPRSFFE